MPWANSCTSDSASRTSNAFLDGYCRPECGWERHDLGKEGMPGPDKLPYAAITPTRWTLTVCRNEVADTARLVAGDTRGLAKRYTMEFTFPQHGAGVEVKWSVFQKTPDPIPEGGWLCFPFAVEKPQFLLGRLGDPIDPATDSFRQRIAISRAVSTGVAVTGPDRQARCSARWIHPWSASISPASGNGRWTSSPNDRPSSSTCTITCLTAISVSGRRGLGASGLRFWPLSYERQSGQEPGRNPGKPGCRCWLRSRKGCRYASGFANGADALAARRAGDRLRR